MQPRGLIDTGALLALLDRDDKWHNACVEAFGRIRLPLVTSAAILAELFHLLGDGVRERQSAWKLLRSGAIRVACIDDTDLADLQVLMDKYADRPMDFADATLVLLARKLHLVDVLTVDHNHFETYRIRGKRKFRVHPPRASARRRG